MKAEIQSRWLICECGGELRRVLYDNFRHYYTCDDDKCEHGGKRFKPPTVELEEIGE